MLRPLRIGITTGDAHGIGPEVVAKALRRIGPQKNVQFILWRNPDFPKRDLQRIRKSFKLIAVNSWAEALTKMRNSPKEILDICGGNSPGLWVEEAASACYFRHLDAMATAPLSKPSIKMSGLKDMGHTEILKRVAQAKTAYMTFLGLNFSVMVATGHIPISQVSQKISFEQLSQTLQACHDFVAKLEKMGTKGLSKKPIGLLGLNPHAGDEGLIGQEEQTIYAKVIEWARKEKINVEGPLVPDAAFVPENWKKFSIYLASYHDQGLIPFKTVHGQKGLHLTWGLSFIRTSVDHGTAFDIAGKDLADATSMRLAIEWAIKLARTSV